MIASVPYKWLISSVAVVVIQGSAFQAALVHIRDSFPTHAVPRLSALQGATNSLKVHEHLNSTPRPFIDVVPRATSARMVTMAKDITSPFLQNTTEPAESTGVSLGALDVKPADSKVLGHKKRLWQDFGTANEFEIKV